MNRKTVYLVVLLFIASNLFTFVGTGVYYRQQETNPGPADPPVVENPRIPAELEPFMEVLDILTERFLEEVPREELINSAIHGMVNSLDDPQTNFLEPSDYEEIMIKIDGSFSGIGIEISSVDDYVTVVSPIRNTPGERAGLLPGDRIIAVDGQDIVGYSALKASKLMRGPAGTTVTLTIEREGMDEPLTFKITRDNIVVPSVFPEMLENSIGYIQITNFDDHTGRDFQEALLELETRGMRGLILDVRDNPGGLLSEAIKIGQEILPPGPITHVVDGDGNVVESYQSFGTKKEYPIVALVNGASASASEIISGALQDTGAGILVGTKTYGKATVQHLENITNGAGLRYTVAKYQTPNGRDIHGEGLQPDVEVELPDDFYLIRYQIISDLEAGAEDPNVLFLQKQLNALGYAVEETSAFDAATENAVQSFQAKYGLTVTGRLDQATRAKLSEEIEAVVEEMDVQKQKALEILLQKIK